MEKNTVSFQVNDLIIYGGSGVCVVKDIRELAIDGAAAAKKYYVLEPVYQRGDVIYSPVENQKTVMRKILTKKETEELIRQIPTIETAWIDDKKIRAEQCKKALSTYNCYELLRIIKAMYLRKESLCGQKKAISKIDDNYFRLAEDLLYGELAIPLGIPKEQVVDYIAAHVEHTANG